MNSFKNILRSVFRRDSIPWFLLGTLTALFAAFVTLAPHIPQAVPADTNETDSVYYSSIPEASQESVSPTPANSKIIKNYVICIQDGAISIFEEGSQTPLHTIDTPPSRLPEADRRLLETGIRIDSLPAAYKLIEDYE